MKVAIVDLGTNTCRLFLARVEGGRGRDGRARDDRRAARPGRRRDRAAASGAVARTRDCLAGYAPRLEAYGPARRLLIATSVLRDALDGRDFLAAVERDFALPSRVLDGEEEGALAFRGGTAALSGSSTAGPASGVSASPSSTSAAAAPSSASACPAAGPTWCAAWTSAWCASPSASCTTTRRRPPSSPRPDAFVRDAIADGVPPAVRAAARHLIGVAGTYTTLVAHKLGLREYRRELVHGHVLTLADIDAAIALFARLTSAERGLRPGIQKGREDVILAGALIAAAACRAFGLASVACSEADILEGAALALADGSLAPSPPALTSGRRSSGRPLALCAAASAGQRSAPREPRTLSVYSPRAGVAELVDAGDLIPCP